MGSNLYIGRVQMFKFFLTLPILFLVACTGPGAGLGFAPGAVTNPVAMPTTTSKNHIKYGEIVTTSNGWEVASDDTDPVEQKTLSNGWTVEVKYE